MKKHDQLLTILMLLTATLFAQQQTKETPSPYLAKTHEKDGQSLNYRILYPTDFDESIKYPLVVFLHGMGERGSDNFAQLTHGSKLFSDSIQQYPAIVIFPQCPDTDFWADLPMLRQEGSSCATTNVDPPLHTALDLVMDLMDEFIAKDFIDDERVYVSGLSMGGFGVWELLWRMPEKIAAAIPICGGGVNGKAAAMINVPIWAIHGVKDEVVPPYLSEMMIFAVQAAGGSARLSLYPDVNHNSWDPAFAEREFLSWLFSKRRKKS
jgi:predicted peptidase